MKRAASAFLLLVGLISAHADSTEINIPWATIEKWLHSSDDQVVLTWEEFQAILRQAGMPEISTFPVADGKVTIPRAEFKRILDRMDGPAAARAYLTQASYTGRIGQKQTSVTGRIRLEVLGKNPKTTIPLFPAGLSFREILLDGRPAVVRTKNGSTCLAEVKPGTHEVTASFSVPAGLQSESRFLSFSVAQTPVTELDFFVPAPGLEIKADGAGRAESRPAPGGTRFLASVPETSQVSLRWNTLVPAEARGPAKIYATVYHLLSIEEDALRVTARLELDILRNSISNVTVRLPEGYTLLDVAGDSIGDWKLGKDDRTLTIPFEYARQGRLDLTLRLEQTFKDKNQVVDFAGVDVLGAQRQNGSMGVELKTTAEAAIAESAGLTRIDVSELAATLTSLSARPMLYGFTYTRTPGRLALDVQKHADVAVISTAVDMVNGVSLVLKDGRRVHHVTYSVRNTGKQFMELALPAKAQVWNAFVEGRPVKPSRRADGKIMIPLNRSHAENGALAAFDVEVLYYQGEKGLPVLGGMDLELAIPDIVVSQVLWSVYVPTENDYLHFGGDVEKEERATGLRPMLGALKGGRDVVLAGLADQGGTFRGYAGTKDEKRARLEVARKSAAYKAKSDFDESQNVGEEVYARQVEREIDFFSKVNGPASALTPATPGEAGVLPIRIAIPSTGQVYRFSKLIVTDSQPLSLHVAFARHAFGASLRWLLLAALAAIIYRRRARLAVVFRRMAQGMREGAAYLARQWAARRSAAL